MAEAFTAGVRPGGLTDDTQIRMLLCYLVKVITAHVGNRADHAERGAVWSPVCCSATLSKWQAP